MATPRGSYPSPGRMESEHRTALGSQKPGPLFSWFVDQEFSPWSSQTHRSPNTHKRYAVSAKSLVGFCGNYPLFELTPGMVERYKLWRIGQCGPTGVNRDLAALRFMLNFAIRLGYIKDNPVTGIKMLAEPQDRMHVLSHTEERAYLETASRTLRDVGVLILGTGMRPEEVLSLKCEDVHLTERYALVPKGNSSTVCCFAPAPKLYWKWLVTPPISEPRSGFFSVLHTWNQKLQLHPHVHCVIPAGGLSRDHARWIRENIPKARNANSRSGLNVSETRLAQNEVHSHLGMQEGRVEDWQRDIR